MIVTFRTKVWSSITVFGDVAQAMLKMAGHSGTVPGAFAAEDVPSAHARLKAALSEASARIRHQTPRPKDKEDDEEPSALDLAMRLGADHPLVHLLEAAGRQGCEVTWSEGAPIV